LKFEAALQKIVSSALQIVAFARLLPRCAACLRSYGLCFEGKVLESILCAFLQ